MGNYIDRDDQHDGIDRRGFLKCMAWAGTGIVWTAAAGLLSSKRLGTLAQDASASATFSFVQISDSHIGFDKEPNKDVVSTLREAVRRVNSLPVSPEFVIHTGDLTQLSKPAEFDTLEQVLKEMKAGHVFFVPGEHDMLDDTGAEFLRRHGKGTKGQGWYSFDHRGVHFIGLVNVVNLKAGGLGLLGEEQLQWLERDVRHLPASTPLVVFAHIPLWAVYPQWGWGTDDSARALSYLKRFGSVTVLNGHIHQVLQKVEGNVRFHTAMSTAFPQPAPGAGPGPGPMKVPADRLRQLLGLTDVDYIERGQALAVVDTPLE
ncbi:MAG: metallophosphoesterase family protein [Bacteroidales bacterium]